MIARRTSTPPFFEPSCGDKAENAGPVSDGYEPTLSASTRSLGDQVEIRIRDNGTGIPPEVKEKMFNPFFTTKPAGEGTGLGLSISHDIIVKQHGGAIDVDTQARCVHRVSGSFFHAGPQRLARQEGLG